MTNRTAATTLLGHDITISYVAGEMTAGIFRIVDAEIEDGSVETQSVFDREVRIDSMPAQRAALDGYVFSSAFGSELPEWLIVATGL
jgi:hypothetical protein